MMDTRGYDVSSRYNFVNQLSVSKFEQTFNRPILELDETEVMTPPDLLPRQKEIYKGLAERGQNIRNNLSTLVKKTTEEGDEYCLIAIAGIHETSAKTGIGEITPFIMMFQEYQKTMNINMVLVTSTPLSSNSESSIQSIRGIQHFIDEEFIFNPYEHIYNSKARLLTKKETQEFLTRNKLTTSVMPRVPANEPVAKYLGAKPDSIIEYTRLSFVPETLLDEEIFHRAVRPSFDRKRKR